ncbi:MAG TPA: hypothetical protein VGL86_14965 [Polyangia bacterium]
MRAVLTLAMVCSGLGCGGGGGGGGGGGSSAIDMAGGGSGGCTVTLSGSVSGTGTCLVTAAYDPTSSTPGVAFEINANTSPAFTFGGLLSSSNNFVDGVSYTQANVVNAAGAITMGTAAWQVVIHNVNGMPDQGTFALDISSAGAPVSNGSGAMDWLSSHGTLNATMPADTGSTATGTVTAQASF